MSEPPFNGYEDSALLSLPELLAVLRIILLEGSLFVVLEVSDILSGWIYVLLVVVEVTDVTPGLEDDLGVIDLYPAFS